MARLSYCAELTKKHDYYHYIGALFAPKEKREHLYALYALHHEILKIRTISGEEMVRLIRLQWWRDAITGLYEDKIADHPVLNPLHLLCPVIPVAVFEQYLDAIEKDLSPEVPATLADLINHVKMIAIPYSELCLRILDVYDDVSKQAAEQENVASQLIDVCRFTRSWSRHGRVMLPAQLLENEGLSAEHITTGQSPDNTKPIIQAILKEAEQHLQQAEKLWDQKNPATYPLMLHMLADKAFIREIRKHHYDVFFSDITLKHFSILWKIFLYRW